MLYIGRIIKGISRIINYYHHILEIVKYYQRSDAGSLFGGVANIYWYVCTIFPSLW